MVQRLVRRSFDEAGAGAPSEQGAREFYEGHRDEFVKPERLRLSQILLRAEKGSAQRAARAAEARRLLARLEAEGQRNPLLFASLAREVSEDAETRSSGGDLGYRSREELEGVGSKALAGAAFALRNPGDESGVVETDLGFHILKLTARQPALNRSFEDVKAELVARIGREQRTKAFDAFVKKLREKAKVEIADAELDKIPVSPAVAPPQ